MTLHDKHPQRMMRDMLKMTHQIFEPIRMSREEGNLSRSVTTRAPATHLGRNRKGAVRHSRDLKSSPVSPTSNDHAGPGVPSIAVEGQTIPENAIAAAVVAAADNGSGVGATPKLVRRPPPSRFNLTRYVSAPEMFSEQSTSKKKPLLNGTGGANGTAENGDAQTPGLLNTTGLKPAAGGDKSIRSPLRQSVMAVEETPEEEDEEDTAIANTMAAEAAAVAAAAATPEIEAKVEAEAEVTSPAVESVVAAPEQDVQAVATAELESTAAEAVAVSTNSSGELPQEWKAVTGQEFEASGRKLERRRKSRQSSLGPNGTAANGVTPDTNGLSAESVLQALREEGN